jgi:hypothetical protein
VSVALNLRVHQGIEEECNDSHKSIGAYNAHTRNEARTATLVQGAFDTEHCYRTYGHRGDQTHYKASQYDINYIQQHILVHFWSQ